MTVGRAAVGRRSVLRGFGGLALLAAVPACSSGFAGTRLTVATGVMGGNYFQLGSALAQLWRDHLGLATEVKSTDGSPDNLARLASGAADVAISQVDSATDGLAGPGQPRALARIYDDVVHVVVPAPSAITSLTGLRGARVSIGKPGSGYFRIAERLLAAAGLSPGTDLRAEQLDLDQSVAALRSGSIDAFFWSSGLPAPAVTELSRTMDIRLLDLDDDVLAAVRAAHPEYAPGTVPADTYGIPAPITTLFVRNILLVRAEMAADLAYALVETLFRAQAQLATVSPLALTIDQRAAIGTQPVPLHAGAERYFREARDS